MDVPLSIFNGCCQVRNRHSCCQWFDGRHREEHVVHWLLCSAHRRAGARALLRANVAHRFQENCAFIEDIDDFPITFQRQAAPSKPLSHFMLQATFTGIRKIVMVVKVTFAHRDTVLALVRDRSYQCCSTFCGNFHNHFRERRGSIFIVAQPGGSSLPKLHGDALSWTVQQRFRVGNHLVLPQVAAGTGDQCRPERCPRLQFGVSERADGGGCVCGVRSMR